MIFTAHDKLRGGVGRGGAGPCSAGGAPGRAERRVQNAPCSRGSTGTCLGDSGLDSASASPCSRGICRSAWLVLFLPCAQFRRAPPPVPPVPQGAPRRRRPCRPAPPARLAEPAPPAPRRSPPTLLRFLRTKRVVLLWEAAAAASRPPCRHLLPWCRSHRTCTGVCRRVLGPAGGGCHVWPAVGERSGVSAMTGAAEGAPLRVMMTNKIPQIAGRKLHHMIRALPFPGCHSGPGADRIPIQKARGLVGPQPVRLVQ